MNLKRKNWDVGNIASQIRSLSSQCANPHNDGFTAFELKKDLYQIKELIEHALNRSPNFGQLEQDWLTEQEKKRIINILKL
jgi:hypothetical protein